MKDYTYQFRQMEPEQAITTQPISQPNIQNSNERLETPPKEINNDGLQKNVQVASSGGKQPNSIAAEALKIVSNIEKTEVSSANISQEPNISLPPSSITKANEEANKVDSGTDSERDNGPKTKSPMQRFRSKSRSPPQPLRGKPAQTSKSVPLAFLQPRPYQYSQLGQQTPDILQLARDNQLPNILFYSDETPITKCKLHLQHIHTKLRKSFEWMESSHDYIQWLFPNHYRSRFNYSSHALTNQEAKLFRESLELGQRLVSSFEQFLDFLGLQASVREASVRVVSRERLADALVRNTHNHLRIRRILACLSVTGLRLLALWLVNILDFVIEKEECLQKKRWGASLREIFEDEWAIYGDSSDGAPLATAIENCFPEHPGVFYEVNQALQHLDTNERFFRDRKQLKVNE